MKRFLPIILLLLLSTVVYGQAGQAARTAKSDPTGTACTAASPELLYNNGRYSCVSSVYALTSVKRASYAIASLPTCNAAYNGQTVNVTDGNKGQRTCRNTTGSTYAWVDDDPVANVVRFGAIADDGLDDSVAFQAAENSGFPVFVPDGTYHFSSGVTANSDNFKMRGQSEAAILRALSGLGSTPILTLDSGGGGTGFIKRVEISNLTFFLPFDANVGIKSNRAWGLEISRCVFQPNGYSATSAKVGIILDGNGAFSYDNYIHHNKFDNGILKGILVTNCVTASSIEANDFVGSSPIITNSSAIIVDGLTGTAGAVNTGIKIHRNTVQAYAIGVDIDANFTQLDSNYFEGGTKAWKLQSTAINWMIADNSYASAPIDLNSNIRGKREDFDANIRIGPYANEPTVDYIGYSATDGPSVNFYNTNSSASRLLGIKVAGGGTDLFGLSAVAGAANIAARNGLLIGTTLGTPTGFLYNNSQYFSLENGYVSFNQNSSTTRFKGTGAGYAQIKPAGSGDATALSLDGSRGTVNIYSDPAASYGVRYNAVSGEPHLFGNNFTFYWSFDGSGHLKPVTNNTVDFGTTSLRPRISYLIDVDASGDLKATVAGKSVQVKTGADACSGASVLVGGTVTVATTCTPATLGTNGVVLITSQIDGGTPGWLRISASVASTSFTITSSSGTDTSTVGWLIVKQN